MSTQTGGIRLAALAATFASAAIAVAGCASGNGGAAPTATPTPTAAPTAAGPAAFADWTARQGFGGSSGLANVLKLANYTWANEATVTAFDLTDADHDVQGLVHWLDQHPATACWTGYHDAVRADLVKVDAAYALAIQAVGAGKPVPDSSATAIVDAAQAASDEAAPAGCP